MKKKNIFPYSSFKGRFIVLECEKNANQDTGYGTWKGIVLREVNNKIDDIYFCMLLENDAKSNYYRPGDIVEATLTANNYSPDSNPCFSDFLIDKIKFLNKLSWMKLK